MENTNIFDKLFFLLWGIVILVAWWWAGSILVDELNSFGVMQSWGIAPTMQDLWPHIIMILVTGSIVLAPLLMIASLVWEFVVIPAIKGTEPETKGNHDRL